MEESFHKEKIPPQTVLHYSFGDNVNTLERLSKNDQYFERSMKAKL